MRKALGLILAGSVLAGAPQALAQEKLTVWFNKGFYPAEDIALNQVIERFQQKTGVKVELSLFGVEDIITKAVSAVEAKIRPMSASAGPSISAPRANGRPKASSRMSATSSSQ